MKSITIIGFLLAGSAAHSLAVVNQSFNNIDSIAGFAKAPDSDPTSTINWDGSSGNPGGALIYTEAASGGLDRLALSSDFLGDRSIYFNGTFSYDLYFTPGSGPIAGNTQNNDIEFVGTSLTLRLDLLPPESANTWLTRSVALDDSAAWINSGTGLLATNAQIQAVLSDVQAIYLIADYAASASPDTTRFDNISLIAIPEPSSAFIYGVLVFISATLGRRQLRN